MEVSEHAKFYTTEKIKNILKNNKNNFFVIDIKGQEKVLIISSIPIKFDNNYNVVLCDHGIYNIFLNTDELLGIPARLFGQVKELLQKLKIVDLKTLKTIFKKSDC